MKNMKLTALLGLLILMVLGSCEQFESFNENPNEPTDVSPDVLLTSALRRGVNAMVTESFLLGNNAAQLTAKTLRTEVDAYNWNAFPTVWEELYGSLTDAIAVERDALEAGNARMEGVSIVLQAWFYATLTNAYGDIPYFDAIRGDEDNFTPAYDEQSEIYADLLGRLDKADGLLAPGSSGSIDGDIIFNGDASKWRKLANSLRLRLLMTAGDNIGDAANQFANIVSAGNIMTSNADNATLTYLNSFPNQYPLVPLKTGDFDAVAFSQSALNVMQPYGDPRLLRYARPDNDMYNENATFSGAVNGSNSSSCPKTGSRLGAQYFNDPAQTTASQLGIGMAEGIIMTYAEVEFLLAEAAALNWITDDVETHYRAGIKASMDYQQVNYGPMGYSGFDDYYTNSGVAYSEVTDIWEQKWLALFFHGLEPYFEVRRWYVESGNGWNGIPFLSAACENLNDDELPLRFLYPGEEQSLNAQNYQEAVQRLGGSNSQNARMWLVE